MSSTTQIIAKNSYKCVGVLFFIFLLSLLFDFLPWVFFFLVVVAVLLHRNPERVYEEDDSLAFVSPADGVVTAVEKSKNKDGEDCLLVTIEKSLIDVGVLRAPSLMSIKAIKEKHGLNLPYKSHNAKSLNERVFLECENENYKFDMRVICGAFAREIDLYTQLKPYKQIQRIGFCSDFKIELFMPANMRCVVSVGECVSAGQSVLAYLQNDK